MNSKPAEVTPELVRRWLLAHETTRNTGSLAPDIAAAYLQVCEELDRLRDEITDRANVEADLRAQLAEAKATPLVSRRENWTEGRP